MFIVLFCNQFNLLLKTISTILKCIYLINPNHLPHDISRSIFDNCLKEFFPFQYLLLGLFQLNQSLKINRKSNYKSDWVNMKHVWNIRKKVIVFKVLARILGGCAVILFSRTQYQNFGTIWTFLQQLLTLKIL